MYISFLEENMHWQLLDFNWKVIPISHVVLNFLRNNTIGIRFDGLLSFQNLWLNFDGHSNFNCLP